MSDWILTKGLQNLREQVNATFPHRDKTSDGTIGDAAHQAETSGHNPDDTAGSKAEWNGDPDSTPEVRAWDMDSDLGGGVSAQEFVDHMRALPGLSSVIRYMIYNRKMYHVSNGFNPTAYTGPSPHTEHVHFSGAWTQAADNNAGFDYHLEDLVALTSDDLTAIKQAVWGYDIDPSSGGYTAGGAFWTMFGRTGALNGLPAAIAEVGAKADEILSTPVEVDTAALVAALVPAIVAALPAGVVITPAELQAAMVGAFRELAAG